MVNYCITASVVYLSLGCRLMGVLSVCLLLISNKPSNLSQLWDILALLLLFNINFYHYSRFSPFLRSPETVQGGEDWRLLTQLTLPLVTAFIFLVGSFLVLSGWNGLLFKLCQQTGDFRADRKVVSFHKISKNKYMLR